MSGRGDGLRPSPTKELLVGLGRAPLPEHLAPSCWGGVFTGPPLPSPTRSSSWDSCLSFSLSRFSIISFSVLTSPSYLKTCLSLTQREGLSLCLFFLSVPFAHVGCVSPSWLCLSAALATFTPTSVFPVLGGFLNFPSNSWACFSGGGGELPFAFRVNKPTFLSRPCPLLRAIPTHGCRHQVPLR